MLRQQVRLLMVVPETALRTVLVIGAENVGKSTLLDTVTGRTPRARNLPGTTTTVEESRTPTHRWLDTPGLRVAGDESTTVAALATVADDDVILVVVAATSADQELDLLLPLVASRPAVIVLSFADRLADPSPGAVTHLSDQLGVPVLASDTRDPVLSARLLAALPDARPLQVPDGRRSLGWALQPPATILDRAGVGPWLALLLALLPIGVGVALANVMAGRLDPLVTGILGPAVTAAGGLPALPAAVLVGDYGLLTMGPLLLVWALPTVVVVAALQGVATASGLTDRLSAALDPLTRHIGLQGRDLTRVLMGFGCNVPAVVGTRSCSSCTRDTTIAAIAWGAACSYQLPATVAVFAAAGRWWLVWPYLLVLLATTVAYAWLVARRQRRGVGLLPLLTRRSFLTRPRQRDVRREAAVVLREFVRKALPIFLGLSVLAALIDHLGLLTAISGVLGPAMGLLGLPAETATPVVLAAVRKDGILLLEQTAPLLDTGQLLAAVFLAGSLLPCLVTTMTIARERGLRLTAGLVGRQAGMALAVTMLLAHVVG